MRPIIQQNGSVDLVPRIQTFSLTERREMRENRPVPFPCAWAYPAGHFRSRHERSVHSYSCLQEQLSAIFGSHSLFRYQTVFHSYVFIEENQFPLGFGLVLGSQGMPSHTRSVTPSIRVKSLSSLKKSPTEKPTRNLFPAPFSGHSFSFRYSNHQDCIHFGAGPESRTPLPKRGSSLGTRNKR
jgi:hypothetical protein